MTTTPVDNNDRNDTSTSAIDPIAAEEARGWLTDCGFDEDTLDDLTDHQIHRLVTRTYDGGWEAFLTAIEGLYSPPGPATTPQHRTPATSGQAR